MEYFVYSPQSLGQQLRRVRKKLGLNQTQAGYYFNIEQSTFSSIERGAPGTRLETLFRVLAALDLEMVLRPKPSHPSEKDPVNYE